VGEVTQGEGSGRNTMIIAVVAILLVAAIAMWAMSRRQPKEERAGTSSTTTEGSATVGDKDDNADVNLKVNVPDSVTIDAH
jgi:flagellar basal body-associated protein FliL